MIKFVRRVEGFWFLVVPNFTLASPFHNIDEPRGGPALKGGPTGSSSIWGMGPVVTEPPKKHNSAMKLHLVTVPRIEDVLFAPFRLV